ncbi:export associated protein [Streptomyces chrestomyceticus JCM 4735]|uniref:Export associated protein n=1 Tax=Streptomyces chrestomyceticus JCM 4735 TaxID=1306181 RepID=A0A7U9Q0H1_9ACTN|nr:TerD family protein [Streptomyces chrestomyceticus]GCD38498.1 export associated protein [Streptomyces chrestomyceticus JCM 4735]
MTAELVRGQNHPLDRTRVEIRIAAGGPVVAGVTLADELGGLAGVEAVAHPGAPRRDGVEVPRQAAAEHRIAVDLDALPAAVHRASVLLALPVGIGGPAVFGAAAAPLVAVTGLDGTELASYTLVDLDAETAVVAVELYRRQGAWKVRAVGQGYAGGLAALFQDQGLPQATSAGLAAEIQEAVRSGHARSVPVPAASPGPVASSSPAGAPGPTGSTAASAPAEPPAPVDYRHPKRRTSNPPLPPQPRQATPTTPPPTPTPPTSAPTPAPTPTTPPSGDAQPAAPVAGDAAGRTPEERLYNQVWGMFEDLARTVAAYRSAMDFAQSRLAKELDAVNADPRNRMGAAAEAARAAAHDKHARLAAQAREVLDRDLGQLTAEAEVVEPALPPAFASWSSPVWQGYRPPEEYPTAVRLGDLRLPECPDLRIPMLVRLPMTRGLWIDSGRPETFAGAETADGAFGSSFGLDGLDGLDGLAGGSDGAGPLDEAEVRRRAVDTAVTLAARLLAVHPVGELTVHVIDPAGSATPALAPLLETGALREPPATGAQGVTAVLGELTRRVDLVQMAVRNQAAEALPPDLDTAEQLLIVHDFPHGFDDRAVNQLRYLADEGPSVGVHLLMVADRAEAREYGPVLDPLWRSLLRVTPVPDAHLADPWVGHAWTYEPSRVPDGSRVLRKVLGDLGEARRSQDHSRSREG